MTSISNIKTFLKNPGMLFIRIGRESFLKLVSDKRYLKLLWKAKFGTELNLESPKTYNEKLQWLKIHNRRPEFSMMVDKFAVKDYIRDLIGEEYVVPTYGVWDKYSDIDFSKLPSKFVLKCTHDSGGIVICKDKEQFNHTAAKKKLKHFLKRRDYWLSREWPYKDVEPRIMAEEYLEEEKSYDDSMPEGMVDYKFFCFSGRSEFIYVSKGLANHSTARMSFYDLKGNILPFDRTDYLPLGEFELPANMDEMIGIADKIASSIQTPFVRVDLYSLNGHIYFSEITFYPCGGFLPFAPPEWDNKLGELIDLDSED